MRKIQTYLFLLVCLATGWVAAQNLVSSAPENADVYFIEPADGAEITSTFTVKFGLRGMGVAPAGIDMENTGHHHLLIDLEGDLDMMQPLPASAVIYDQTVVSRRSHGQQRWCCPQIHRNPQGLVHNPMFTSFSVGLFAGFRAVLTHPSRSWS